MPHESPQVLDGVLAYDFELLLFPPQLLDRRGRSQPIRALTSIRRAAPGASGAASGVAPALGGLAASKTRHGPTVARLEAVSPEAFLRR